MYITISDQHEQSLNKILRGHQSDVERKVNSDTDTTIALAEHLLGKLSPGKSYIIDSRVKRKGKCRCGFNHCMSDPVFGSTGIGMLLFKYHNVSGFVYILILIIRCIEKCKIWVSYLICKCYLHRYMFEILVIF